MGELEALLSKYNFTGEVDAKEFLNKLLFEGNTVYLDNFRANFKDNLLTPVSDKFNKFYGALNAKLESLNTGKEIQTLVDPLGLSKISKQYEKAVANYKANIEKFLNKKFEEPKAPEESKVAEQKERKFTQAKNGQWQETTESGKKLFVSSETVEQYKKQQETKPSEVLNKTSESIQAAIPEPVKNLETNQLNRNENNIKINEVLEKLNESINLIIGKFPSIIAPKKEEKEGTSQEQKSFGPKVNLIDFSDTGKEYIKTLLNDVVKKISFNTNLFTINQQNQAKSGLSDLWFLLLELISDAIPLSGKLEKSFQWLFKLPERVLAKWEAMFKESEILKWIGTKWTNFITRVKEITKFDEIVERVTSGVNRIMTPIKNIGKTAEQIGVGITEAFGEGGKLSGISRFFTSIGQSGEGVLSFISKIRGPFAGIIEMVANIAPLFEVLEKFLGPIALLIDAIVDSVKTLFSVFSDDNLSPIQKATAVLMSFIGGFDDIIITIIDWIAKLRTGAFSWLMGNGFKTDNAVSKGLNEFTGGESLGVSLGKKTIDLEKTINGSQNGILSDLWTGITGEVPTPAGGNTLNQNNGKTIPIQDAIIDASYIQGTDGNRYMPSKEDTIIASKPDGGLDKSIKELKNVMVQIHKGIVELNNKDVSSNNISSVNISSQNSKKSHSSSRDLNFHAREEWWRLSSNRGVIL